MHRLLEDRSPETFTRAYAHYHLVVEGILAQTGYCGVQRSLSADGFPDLPHLEGLHAEFSKIRQDEGRHVGFGMTKLKRLVRENGVDPQLVDDTVTGLMPLVTDIAANADERTVNRGIEPAELQGYAADKHGERTTQIRQAASESSTVGTQTSPGDD